MGSTLEISELGTPSPHEFFLLYPQIWHKCDVNVIIQKPHIISMSLHDTLMMSCPLLVGKSAHLPGHLSGGSCSELNAKVDALITPSSWRGKWQLQVHTMTHSPRYFDVPPCQANQGMFYLNMHRKIYMNVKYVQEYFQECKKVRHWVYLHD